MMLNANIKIELTREQQSEAIIKILCEDYYRLAITAHELENEMETRILESYETQDYVDTTYVLEAMDVILENYMDPTHYENWSKAWANTRRLYLDKKSVKK